MKKTQREYLNLLYETMGYYHIDPTRRSLSSEPSPSGHFSCMYLSDNGNMCAVGRCLSYPGDLPPTAAVASVSNLEGKLKEEYRGYKKTFWAKLQGLHDFQNYWDKDGLTKEGIARCKEIKSQILKGRWTSL